MVLADEFNQVEAIHESQYKFLTVAFGKIGTAEQSSHDDNT